jgi:hypothetical protein
MVLKSLQGNPPEPSTSSWSELSNKMKLKQTQGQGLDFTLTLNKN